MILLHKSDIAQLPADTPEPIKAKIQELLEKLDKLYGEERGLENDGGYVCYIPNNEDCEKILKVIDISSDDVCEHVDIIPTDTGDFLYVLYLFNNEYGVVVIVGKDNAPPALLKEVMARELTQFSVVITEILQRTVIIGANTGDEALELAKKKYDDEMIVLDSSDFQNVEFDIKEQGVQ